MNQEWAAVLDAAAPVRTGRVSKVSGLSVDAHGLECSVGDVLQVVDHGLIEVVAVSADTAHCMPLTFARGLSVGLEVRHTGGPLLVPGGRGLLGRVLNGVGEPIDGAGPLRMSTRTPLARSVPSALSRQRINEPMATSVRVLDTLITLGKGQRIGLFAGSGVGKSTLLSMVARGASAPISVIALVGERGREVREFLEDDLGPEGLARSVVVVATSDEPAMVRMKAAFLATAIAAGFRAEGEDVVLMMDSLTRVAMAQREIGLSVGEPPATRGYPPSAFSTLAELLEQAGSGPTGSVTGIYTVLVDGDDHNEPIADAARSILDGHVVLDRALAVSGHYPSVDALASISRVATKLLDPGQRRDATNLRRYLAARVQVQDLLDVGAYVAGSNPYADAAIALADDIEGFLTQDIHEQTTFTQAWDRLHHLAAALEAHRVNNDGPTQAVAS